MHKRDRFELLSAYVDGEVTAAEGRQIEDWLTIDPEVQRLYARVLKLRQRWRTMPVLPEGQPVERTVRQVFPRLNKRRKMDVVGGVLRSLLCLSALCQADSRIVNPLSRQWLKPDNL